VRLLYSNRSEEEIAFRAELDALEGQNERFRVIHTLTGPEASRGWSGLTGRVDPGKLAEASKGLRDPVYYVCGKPAMASAVVGHLLGMGVPQADIVLEVFRGYPG